MGTEPPQELLRQWRLEQMTVEMATGYILQTLVKACEEIERLTRSSRKLRLDVERLIAHTALPPQPTGKRRYPKRG